MKCISYIYDYREGFSLEKWFEVCRNRLIGIMVNLE